MSGGVPRLGLRDLAGILRQPVVAESRRNLAATWVTLPAALRSGRQMLGRQGNGCGATIGAMPRCDFACRGCYLGDEANTTPAEPVEVIKAQMRLLRPTLGNAGNLQLTDGEVTLRPEAEVVELLRYARTLGLIPMLMTHGDSFRRRPGLLERLMVDGRLTEVSIHVDTTQRGRLGDRWRAARTEADLNPLRAEFDAMVRAAVRRTGRPLRAATTMTVTRENLAGVADVVRWLAAEGEAFRMISFQPIAQVGRTQSGLGGGVAVEALWDAVAEGLAGDEPVAAVRARLDRGHKWLGHPGCNRFVHGLVSRRAGGAPRYLPVREDGDPVDEAVVDGFLRRFGGVSFRLDDHAAERAARMLGLLARAPGWAARHVPRFAWHWLRRLGGGRPLRGAADLLAGRVRVQGLVLVSHHFMSRDELQSPEGRERLASCVFHVPVDGRLVSMCETNALGLRDRHYATLRRREAPAPSLRS